MKYIVCVISPKVKAYVRALYNLSRIENYFALIPYDTHPYLVEKLSSITDDINFSVIDIGPDDIDEIAYSYDFDIIGVQKNDRERETLGLDRRRCLLFDSSKRYPEGLSQSLKASFVGSQSTGSQIFLSDTLLEHEPTGWNESDSDEAGETVAVDRLRMRRGNQADGSRSVDETGQRTSRKRTVSAIAVTSGLIGASWLCAFLSSRVYKSNFHLS